MPYIRNSTVTCLITYICRKKKCFLGVSLHALDINPKPLFLKHSWKEVYRNKCKIQSLQIAAKLGFTEFQQISEVFIYQFLLKPYHYTATVMADCNKPFPYTSSECVFPIISFVQKDLKIGHNFHAVA